MNFKVTVGISNRHVHLTKEVYEQLFSGEIEKDKDVKQTGEYASTSFVNLIGPKGKIEHVRVMGPLRDYNQVEIASSDAYLLGLHPPVRRSGNLKGSETVTVEVNGVSIKLEESCILAKSHIHMNTFDLEKYGVKDTEIVKVLVDKERKGCFYAEIKAKENFVTEFHVDRDEANAFLLQNGEELTVEKCLK